MKMNTSWTCMVLMLLVMAITADNDKVCDSNSQAHAAGLCGHTLTDVMLLVCSGRGFNSRSKRQDYVKPQLGDIILGKRISTSYLRKRESEIVCECCYNQCEIQEMESYCFRS